MLKRGKIKNEFIESELQKVHGLVWQANSDYTSNLQKQQYLTQARNNYTALQSSTTPGLDSYNFLSFNDFVDQTKDICVTEFIDWINGISYRSIPPIPYDNSASSYGTIGPVIAIENIKQTDVVDILEGVYEHQNIPIIQLGVATPIDIEPIITAIHQNIVVLSDNGGMNFGSGLLIHSRLVLTARHCLEGRTITNILIHNNYQKQHNREVVDFWTHNKVNKVVEEDSDLDYAIILLKDRVTNFREISLRFDSQCCGSSIFLHHPMGGPKKVSIHQSLESNSEMWSYSGFHDSQKGSSGGVYIDVNGKVFALHCLKMGSNTNAKWIKDIYQKSITLKLIFKLDGTVKNSIFLSFDNPVNQNLLPSSDRQSYREYLETIDRQPSEHFPQANAGRNRMPDLAHHHIIPKSNLEFLWSLGKEFSRIENLLKQLAWRHPHSSHIDSEENLIANNVIWSTWNLFTGPSNRPGGLEPGFDPKVNQFAMEPAKPFSFNEELWKKLTNLHNKITEIYNLRNDISKLTKERIIELLDQSDGSGVIVNTTGELAGISNPFVKYRILLNQVCALLRPILPHYTTDQTIHLTNNDDWTIHDGYQISFKKTITGMKIKVLYLYYDERTEQLLYSTITPAGATKIGIELSGSAFNDLKEKMKNGIQLIEQEKFEIIRETTRKGDTISDSYRIKIQESEKTAKVMVYFVNKIVFDNPILNSGILDLIATRKKSYDFKKLLNLAQDDIKDLLDSIKLYGLEKAVEYFFEDTNSKNIKFLETAEQFLTKEDYNLLKELFIDQSIAEQILLATDELGIEKILEILFGDKVKVLSLEEITNSNKLKTQDDQIIEIIAQIESIIGKETLSEIAGWHKYISIALSNNPLSSSATKVIQIIDNLANNLEQWLDFGSVYESLDIENQVTIILSQLEHWVDFIASGITYVGLPPRYPDFDSDYDFGGGGSSSGNDNAPNDEQSDNNLFVYYFTGQNSTMGSDL